MNIEKEKELHKEALNYKDFEIEFKAISKLGDREVENIKRYGHWLNKLTNGEIKPITEKQKIFLKVIHENKQVDYRNFSQLQCDWIKYLDILKLPNVDIQESTMEAENNKKCSAFSGMGDKYSFAIEGVASSLGDMGS